VTTLKRHILLGGFLGYGLLLAVPVVIIVTPLKGRGLSPGLWVLFTVLYLVAALSFGWIRWFLRDRVHGSGEETRLQKCLRPVWAGLLTLPVLFLVLSLVMQDTYLWDGGFQAARYTFIVVDPSGDPLPNTEFVVDGPFRQTWERDWLHGDGGEGLPPRLPGFWPIFEYGGDPLYTDEAGRLVVHQADHGLQFSGSGYRLFGIHFDISATKPDIVLEFRRKGYEPWAIDFDDLNRRAVRDGGREVKGPRGRSMPEIEVRVVMAPQ